MGMDEIPLAEFISRRKINPYGNPRANFRGNDLFWTKQQNLIYLDVIKAKQNTHVEVKWINMLGYSTPFLTSDCYLEGIQDPAWGSG